MAAPARSSHTELRRPRARRTPPATANPAVVPSMIAARPSSQVTAASSASDATLTPSRKAPAVRERRTRGSNCPMSATKMKDGRKMPTVATTAPGTPARM